MSKLLSFFDRLDKFMEYSGLNDNKITNETGISNGIIGKGRKRGALSQDNISKILYRYPELDANWLFTGEGKMIKSSDNQIHQPQENESQMINETQMSVYKLKTDYFGVEKQSIPLYDISAAAGLSTIFSNQTQQVPLDHIILPNAPKCDGAMYIRGDSMYPLLKSGDIACYKSISSIENVIFGEKYILDICNNDDDFLTVKYVKQSDKGDEYFKLVSENKHHADRDIHISSIRAIAIVKATIRFETLS